MSEIPSNEPAASYRQLLWQPADGAQRQAERPGAAYFWGLEVVSENTASRNSFSERSAIAVQFSVVVVFLSHNNFH